MVKKDFNFDINRLKNIPQSPGVYFWKDVLGNIIYVGKAINLQKRMQQYFKGSVNSYKTEIMVKKIADFEVHFANNEKDALLMEQTYIKQIRPAYNILLMDDKVYPYLKIQLMSDRIKYSTIYKHVNQDKNTIVIGPFVPAHGIKKLREILENQTLYQNGLLIKNSDSDFWQKKFNFVEKMLNNVENYKKILNEKIAHETTNYNYESASQIDRVIQVLNTFSNEQLALIKKYKSIDVFVFKAIGKTLHIFSLFYRNGLQIGQLFDSAYFELSVEDAILQFLKNHYVKHVVPQFVVLPYEYNNIELKGLKFIFPQKAELKKIIDYAFKSLESHIHLQQSSKKQIKDNLIELSNILNLKRVYNFIILDISHSNQNEKIGAVNFYLKGQEYRAFNRYFNLVSASSAENYLMSELAEKYLKTFVLKDIYLDVIFVDGGIIQVNAVKSVLKKFKLNLPVIGLVKNNKHMTENIYYNQRKIEINNENLLNYFRQIQERVDAKAKYKFNKKHRSNIFVEPLMELPNIGYKKVNALLKVFKSYENISKANLTELEKVLGKKDSKTIYEYYLLKK